MVGTRQKAGIYLTHAPLFCTDNGELKESGFKPFCNIHEGEHRKKHQNIAPQSHEGSLFFAERSSGKPGKNFMSLWFCQYLFPRHVIKSGHLFGPVITSLELIFQKIVQARDMLIKKIF